MPPKNSSDELFLQILQELRKEVGEMRVEMGVIKTKVAVGSSATKSFASLLASVFGGVAVVWLAKVMNWN